MEFAKTAKFVFNHPFAFAAGVGIANGALAIARNKKIDLKTAVTLSAVLGIGELVLVMYEPPEHRGAYTLNEVAIHSVLGVMAGVLPFITWGAVDHGEKARPLLVASTEPAALPDKAMAGYHQYSPRRKPPGQQRKTQRLRSV